MEKLIVKLHEINAVKFGNFTLKSGLVSPVYIDLRVIISYPVLMSEVSELLWKCSTGADYATICGVPYTALPLATCIAANHNIPMLIRRKEAKDYGTKKMLEGHYQEGTKCLIVEDVVTTGSSVQETADLLSQHGLVVSDAVVLLDREQGGSENLAKNKIKLKSVLTLSKVVECLCSLNKIETSVAEQVKRFISENNTFRQTKNGDSVMNAGIGTLVFPPKHQVDEVQSKTYGGASTKRDVNSFRQRAKLCKHKVTQKLFEIMESKQTNLCLSVDVEASSDLIELVETLGPLICAVKTHIDILDDFSLQVLENLTNSAQRHNFLIFEDRKFADIGNTVKAQYSGGIFKIADWADITNAHALPGSGIIKGLKAAVKDRDDRGCLLLAQMSTEGNLVNKSYTEATVKMAEEHSDFIIGFICQSKLSNNPAHVHFTPGVKLSPGKDQLGQQYRTPDVVIRQLGCDVIIVGRGIIESANRLETARAFRNAGWTAYMQRLNLH